MVDGLHQRVRDRLDQRAEFARRGGRVDLDDPERNCFCVECDVSGRNNFAVKLLLSLSGVNSSPLRVFREIGRQLLDERLTCSALCLRVGRVEHDEPVRVAMVAAVAHRAEPLDQRRPSVLPIGVHVLELEEWCFARTGSNFDVFGNSILRRGDFTFESTKYMCMTALRSRSLVDSPPARPVSALGDTCNRLEL